MKALFSLLALCALVLPLRAQMWDNLYIEPSGIDTTMTQRLGLKVDATAFFRDNEYDTSELTQGYTLPGVRIRPVLTYNPIDQIHLELGAYAIFYNGANKYPNYAYHDIATWKGSQYQRGAHALPFFRAEARFKDLTLVFGDLYGAQNHRLIEPMYNPELNISADPEMGFQLLLDRPHIHFDVWLDWQSYIYKLDSHQEAFTVGANATIAWNPAHPRLKFTTPVQLLLQHRGGEQDTTQLGVQTVANASIGLHMDYAAHRRVLDNVHAEVNLLGSYQQSGTLWPFDGGFAMHAAFGMTLWDSLSLKLGYVGAPKQFANLYGNPFFSTLGIKEEEVQLHGIHTAYLRADYTYAFTDAYKIGAEFEAISAHSKGLNEFNFSFGVYIHVTPSFVLKSFRK